jgi:hypothetical protein
VLHLYAALVAADQYANGLLPVLRAIQADGAISIGATMHALNERTILSPRGSRWHFSSTAKLIARAQRLDIVR